MISASFSFSGGLNDFLARDLRGRDVPLSFSGHQSVKHLFEALGVPHVEVGAIRTGGKMVGFGYRPLDGDRIEVLPIVPGCPVDPRFLLDGHLGRLAAYLRMLGFDCLYCSDYTDVDLAGLVEREVRILLSRDRRLLMRKVVQFGYCLRSLDPGEQLVEVVKRFQLADKIIPFRRCLRCNGPLEPVSKESVLDRLEPKTKLYYNEFAICQTCDQVYWKGSHYARMQTLVARVTS